LETAWLLLRRRFAAGFVAVRFVAVRFVAVRLDISTFSELLKRVRACVRAAPPRSDVKPDLVMSAYR
jgi:hypothetical protein